MKPITTHSTLVVLAVVLACRSSSKQAGADSTMVSGNRSPHQIPDSLYQIFRAYDDKRISADVAAKAIVDEVRRTNTTAAFVMDLPLRKAIAREMQARRKARPADDTGSP